MDISQYTQWQRQGHRQIKISIGSITDPDHVWLYDYDLGCGARVALGAQPPTADEMRREHRALLRQMLTDAEGK